MMFLAVVLILAVGIHYIAKTNWHGTAQQKQQDNNTQIEPLPNLSEDGEFNPETEREFQKIIEGIKKEQK